jgi:hypothetical protein
MHGSPILVPPTHVFTHFDPAPFAVTHGVSVEQAVTPHVTADGHVHGPLNAYLTNFTPSTTAATSKALTSAFGSITLGCIEVIGFTRAPDKFFNLLTTAATSRASGCVAAAGGLKFGAASPERRVNIVTGADTAVQPVSTPWHTAPYTWPVYSELGAISAPTTVISPTGFQS